MGAGFMAMAAEQHQRRVSRGTRLRRLQRGVVEGKIAVGRVSTYTGVATFLLVAFLWVDKAYDAWHVDMDYFAFMGVILVGALILGIAWTLVDRRLIWPREQGVTTGVNPLARTEAFRSAKHLVDLELAGVETRDIEEDLRRSFAQAGLLAKFDADLRAFRVTRLRTKKMEAF